MIVPIDYLSSWFPPYLLFRWMLQALDEIHIIITAYSCSPSRDDSGVKVNDGNENEASQPEKKGRKKRVIEDFVLSSWKIGDREKKLVVYISSCPHFGDRRCWWWNGARKAWAMRHGTLGFFPQVQKTPEGSWEGKRCGCYRGRGPVIKLTRLIVLINKRNETIFSLLVFFRTRAWAC